MITIFFGLSSPTEFKKRWVLTFHNSSLAIESSLFIPENFTLIKQYGRRLVLELENQNQIQDEQVELELLSYYGNYDYVENVEQDSILEILDSGSETQSLVQSFSFNSSHDWNSSANASFKETIEWQFQAREPFGMRIQEIWNKNIGSSDVQIAIVDSGISKISQHEHWFEHLKPGYDFITNPQFSQDNDGRDMDAEDIGGCSKHSWHGTKIAVAIAAKHKFVLPHLHSVAPNISIQPIRVLNPCGQGYANDVTDAIVWAAGGFINGIGYNPYPSNVICLAFGGKGKCPSYLQSAVSLATNQHNAFVVAAAGNEASNAEDVFPANCAGVIAIGASTRNGNLAAYSNTGKNVYFLSPGGSEENPIQSMDLIPHFPVNGSFEVVPLQEWGTSYSTAFASGFIGLFFHKINNFSNTIDASRIDPFCHKESFYANEYMKWTCVQQKRCGHGIISSSFNESFKINTNKNQTWILDVETKHPNDNATQEESMVYAQSYDVTGKYGAVSKHSSLGGGSINNLYDGVGNMGNWGNYPYTFSTTCTSWLPWVQYDLGSNKKINWIYIKPYTGDRVYCRLSLDISPTGGFGGEHIAAYSCGQSSGSWCSPISTDGLNVTNVNSIARFVRWTMGGSNLACCSGSFFIQFLVGFESYVPEISLPKCLPGASVKHARIWTRQCLNTWCPAWQTSTWQPSGQNWGAQNAVNGNLEDWSYTLENANERPSWRVDFQLLRPVYKIIIHLHCCMGGYSDLQVWRGDSSTFNGAGNVMCYLMDASINKIHTILTCSGTYRYLFVYRDNAPTNLILKEVEAYEAGTCDCNEGHILLDETNTSCRPCRKGYACPNKSAEILCPINTYTEEAFIKCTACPNPSTSGEGASFCICNKSYYAPNASVCEPCTPGYVCPENTNARYECPNNTWSLGMSTHYMQCNFCKEGYIYNDTNMCRACNPGFFCLNSTVELSCPPGTYSTEGKSMCSDCPVNTYNDRHNSSECINCTPFSTSPWKSTSIENCTCHIAMFRNKENYTCRNCSLGFYCPSMFTEIPCSLGEIAKVPSTACEKCLPGSYNNKTGSSSCALCHQGEFVFYAGATSLSNCSFCVQGKYASAFSSTVCIQCTAGTYGSGIGFISVFNCSNCSAGTFSTSSGILRQQSCLNCTPGTYEMETGKTTCTFCTAGTFSTLVSAMFKNNCTLCPSGSFSLSRGLTLCTLCSPGTYSTGSGMNFSSTCTACPINTFNELPGGNSLFSCQNCTFASYANAGSTLCTCNAGFMETPLPEEMASYSFEVDNIASDTVYQSKKFELGAYGANNARIGWIGRSGTTSFLTTTTYQDTWQSVAIYNSNFARLSPSMSFNFAEFNYTFSFWFREQNLYNNYVAMVIFNIGPLSFGEMATRRNLYLAFSDTSSIAKANWYWDPPKKYCNKHYCGGNPPKEYEGSGPDAGCFYVNVGRIGDIVYGVGRWPGHSWIHIGITTEVQGDNIIVQMYTNGQRADCERYINVSKNVLSFKKTYTFGSLGASSFVNANEPFAIQTASAMVYIDDLKIYRQALTQSQIRNISQNIKLTPTCSLCPATLYCTGTVTRSCPSNQKSPPGSSSVSQCTTCPNNSSNKIQSQNYNIDTNSCSDCLSTFVINGTETCRPCTLGAFCPNATLEIPCALGSFSNQSSTFCLNCAPGTYMPAQGNTACLSCPGGTFATGIGYIDIKNCSICSKGFYSNNGSTACLACPIGKYNPMDGNPLCFDCEDNKQNYSTTLQNTSIVKDSCRCIAGFFETNIPYTVTQTFIECQACQSGYYSSGVGMKEADTCKICWPGTFSIANRSTSSCTQCSSGSWSNISGATSCTNCSNGTLGAGLGFNNSEQGCLLTCPSAIPPASRTCSCYPIFNTVVFNNSCQCTRGHHSNMSNINQNLGKACGAAQNEYCSATAKTTYHASYGPQFANDGNLNSFYHSHGGTFEWWRLDMATTRTVGTVRIFHRLDCCTDRSNGYELWIGDSTTYNLNVKCYTHTGNLAGVFEQVVECIGRGRYLYVVLPPWNWLQIRDLEVYATCLPCPPGKYSVSTYGSMECRDCPRGTFTSSPGYFECTTCLPGKYNNLMQATECLDCPRGTWSDKTAVSACIGCNPGYYSPELALTNPITCTICSIGHYSLQDATSCIQCIGSWMNVSGSSFCYLCEPGKFSNVTASTQDTCTECLDPRYPNSDLGGSFCSSCIPGQYTTLQPDLECEYCPAGTWSRSGAVWNCTRCPAGKYGAGPGFSTENESCISSCPTFPTKTTLNMTKQTCDCPFGNTTIVNGECHCQMGFFSSVPPPYEENIQKNCPSQPNGRCSLLCTPNYGNQGWCICSFANDGNEGSLFYANGGDWWLRMDFEKSKSLTHITLKFDWQSADRWNNFRIYVGNGTTWNLPENKMCFAHCCYTLRNYAQLDVTLSTPCIGRYLFLVGTGGEVKLYETYIHNRPSCVLCTKSLFQSAYGATTCSTCQGGTYTHRDGQGHCKTCLTSTYSLNASTTCLLCLPGTWSNTTGVSTCAKCTGGKYSTAIAALQEESCMTCAPGTYTKSGYSKCEDCVPGTWTTSSETSACTLCPSGKYSTERASIEDPCVPCSSFQPNSVNASTFCSACVAGEYTGPNESCVFCPINMWSSIGAVYNCTSCNVPSFGAGIGFSNSIDSCLATCPSPSTVVRGSCECPYANSTVFNGSCHCRIGHYSTTDNLTYANNLEKTCGILGNTACSTSASTTAGGTPSRVIDGNAGTYWTAHWGYNQWWMVDLEFPRHMTLIQLYQYCCHATITGLKLWIGNNTPFNHASNINCFSGGTFASTDVLINAPQCIGLARFVFIHLPGPEKMSIGEIGIFNMPACIPCPEGSSASSYGSKTCSQCAPGTIAAERGKSRCSLCPQGKYSLDFKNCLVVECSPGFFHTPNTSTCTAECPPGYFCSGDATAKPCPAGSFSSQWKTNCSTCPPNHYCPLMSGFPMRCPKDSNSSAGSSSINQCVVLSEPGYYGTTLANMKICTPNHFCGSGSITPTPCPQNTDSPMGSAEITNCTPSAGYFGQPGLLPTPCPSNFKCAKGSTAPQPCNTCSHVQLSACKSDASRDTACACNASSYLDPQNLAQCLPCPPYTTSIPNNVDTTVWSCRCVAGYYCKYARTLTLTLTLNISASELTPQLQASILENIAKAAGVPVSSVNIMHKQRSMTTSQRHELKLRLKIKDTTASKASFDLLLKNQQSIHLHSRDSTRMMPVVGIQEVVEDEHQVQITKA